MNKIIQRIKKLLALGNSDNENEAEQALAMARKLMMEHAISLSDVESVTDTVESIGGHEFFIDGLKLRTKPVFGDTRTAHWKRDLVHTIADYLDIQSSWRQHTPRVTLYGTEADAEIAAYLWEVAAQQIVAATKRWRRSGGPRSGYTANDFKRSAVWGLASKLRDLKRAETATGATAAQGNALMLRKKSAVTEWVKQNVTFSKARADRGSYSSNADGYSAGQRIRLHRGVPGRSETTKQLGG